MFICVASWDTETKKITAETRRDTEVEAAETVDQMIADGYPNAFFTLVPEGSNAYLIVQDGAVVYDEAAEISDINRASALSSIDYLESKITPRRLREAVLTPEGKAWMESQEALIAAERAKL